MCLIYANHCVGCWEHSCEQDRPVSYQWGGCALVDQDRYCTIRIQEAQLWLCRRAGWCGAWKWEDQGERHSSSWLVGGWIMALKRYILRTYMNVILFWKKISANVIRILRYGDVFWIIGWALNPESVLITEMQREIWKMQKRGRHRKEEEVMCGHGDRGLRDVAKSQGMFSGSGSCKDKEWCLLPKASREMVALLTCWFWISSLQNCKRINFYCLIISIYGNLL